MTAILKLWCMLWIDADFTEKQSCQISSRSDLIETFLNRSPQHEQEQDEQRYEISSWSSKNKCILRALRKARSEWRFVVWADSGSKCLDPECELTVSEGGRLAESRSRVGCADEAYSSPPAWVQFLNFHVKMHGFMHLYCEKLLVARNLDQEG